MSDSAAPSNTHHEAPALSSEQQSALDNMRSTFKEADGSGLEMNDSTFLRYLRAR